MNAKLKGVNFKQLLINHVEKLVLGVVALLALACVFGARWAGHDQLPRELVKEVDNRRQKILASKWTEKKRQPFENTTDIRDRADKMLSALDGSRFVYNNVMSWPLYEKQAPIKEPDWSLVEDLIATPGRVILATRAAGFLNPDGSVEPGAGPGGLTSTGAPDGKRQPGQKVGGNADLDFAVRRGVGSRPGAANPAVPDAFDPADQDLAAVEGAGMGRDGGLYGGGGGGAGGRGARYICVRGVFPLRTQIKSVARALNEGTYTNVANLVEILDFKLQRQTAVADANPWKGKWDDVDIQVALDVLEEAGDFEPDVVESGVLSAVMTMPLPPRVTGMWAHRGSHPRLEHFELSAEEMRREMLINQKIIEQFERERANRVEPVKPGGFAKPGGFLSQQVNIREMTQSVMAGPNGQSFAVRMGSQLSAEQLKQNLVNDLQQRANPAGRLLLFRYFDFDVEPGRAYRYRVRLTFRNPNFGRAAEEVIRLDVAKGATRQNEWSTPTERAVIAEDVEYFLARIETHRSRPDMPNALVDVYQWSPEVGTMLNNVITVQAGQIIGGTSLSLLLDPGTGTFEEADVTIKTGSVLVDLSDGPAYPLIKPDYHPELTFPKERMSGLGITDQALVVERTGELRTLDEISERAQHGEARRRLELERAPFAALRNKAQAVDAADPLLQELAGEEAIDPAMEEAMRKQEQSRRVRNPLRRRTGRGSR